MYRSKCHYRFHVISNYMLRRAQNETDKFLLGVNFSSATPALTNKKCAVFRS